MVVGRIRLMSILSNCGLVRLLGYHSSSNMNGEAMPTGQTISTVSSYRLDCGRKNGRVRVEDEKKKILFIRCDIDFIFIDCEIRNVWSSRKSFYFHHFTYSIQMKHSQMLALAWRLTLIIYMYTYTPFRHRWNQHIIRSINQSLYIYIHCSHSFIKKNIIKEATYLESQLKNNKTLSQYTYSIFKYWKLWRTEKKIQL